MTTKRFFALMTAVFAIFAFTGMAMAVNRVEVKVTSEPIGFGAICDKAGGFSLEFDAGSVITVGDQITIDLDYKTPSVFTQICKAIDLEVSNGGSGTPWTAAQIIAATDGPLTYTDAAAVVSTLTNVGAGIYFRVAGAVNTQRITIDVMGAAGDSMTVGGDIGDVLVLKILDQKSNAIDWAGGGDEPGIYVDTAVAGTYNVAATASDNTLCIDVSNWDEATVDGNMDSMADKFTFIPSDPQVAHIAAAASYSFDTCGTKASLNVGRIECGTRGVQAADTCEHFDFETGGGYVAGTRSGNPRVLIRGSSAYPLVNYQIKLDIYVNGVAGDNGIYFSNEPVRADGYDTDTAACAVVPNTMPNAGAQANYTYLNGVGAPLVAGNIVAPVVAGVGSCDIAAATRAVSITTDEDNLDLAMTNDYLQLDLPALNYDLDDISADDVVSVMVSLIKAPCGTIFSDTIMIGTMCAVPPVQVLTSTTVVYPYFTAMTGDNWWDGLVVTNLSNADGLFTALVYEMDGDYGAFTGAVDANGLYLDTLENALAGASMVTAGSDGSLGNSQCYILVCTDFTADGFAFMGSLSSNTLMANESMGYVPRVDYYNANDVLPFCTNLAIVPGSLP